MTGEIYWTSKLPITTMLYQIVSGMLAFFSALEHLSRSLLYRRAGDTDINPLGWTRIQEVSNGRAALAGLVAAAVTESTSHISTFDQLFGRYAGFCCIFAEMIIEFVISICEN